MAIGHLYVRLLYKGLRHYVKFKIRLATMRNTSIRMPVRTSQRRNKGRAPQNFTFSTTVTNQGSAKVTTKVNKQPRVTKKKTTLNNQTPAVEKTLHQSHHNKVQSTPTQAHRFNPNNLFKNRLLHSRTMSDFDDVMTSTPHTSNVPINNRLLSRTISDLSDVTRTPQTTYVRKSLDRNITTTNENDFNMVPTIRTPQTANVRRSLVEQNINRPTDNDFNILHQTPSPNGINNNALPKEVMDFIARSQCQQDTMMNMLLSMSAKGSPADKNTEDFEELVPDFPIEDVGDFKDLELLLVNNSTFKKQLVRHLAMFGGSDPKESCKILLHHCIGKFVALQYSLQGKGKLKKKAFNSTKFYGVLKGAIMKRHNKLYDDVQVKTVIMNFLKNAKDRDGGREERRKKSRRVENEEEDEDGNDSENEQSENERSENEQSEKDDEDDDEESEMLIE